ncbi:hypothetical protein [Lacipirellula sp.]|uniref:hypothetical protein n=1 Tax=Lacipirellula sp. TaxID=2691419 RepID=UPI003D11CBA8
MRISSLLLLVACALCVGCLPFGPKRHATYISQKIYNPACPFRGVPVQVYKLHAAVVTSVKDGKVEKSIHFIQLSELFAVDIQKAFLGKTEAKATISGDGALTGMEGKIDQEIPEILTSVSEILNALPLDPAAMQAYSKLTEGDVPKNTFNPALPAGAQIIGISWVPMDGGSAEIECESSAHLGPEVIVTPDGYSQKTAGQNMRRTASASPQSRGR